MIKESINNVHLSTKMYKISIPTKLSAKKVALKFRFLKGEKIIIIIGIIAIIRCKNIAFQLIKSSHMVLV